MCEKIRRLIASSPHRLMHIAIDAQLLNTDATYRGAGVSSYSQNLLRTLGRAKGSHTITAFINDERFDADGVHLRRTLPLTQHPLLRILWEQTVLPVALVQAEADLVHGLVNVLPLAATRPGVVTVHDLSFLRMPEKFPTAKRLYLTQLCRRSVEKANRVIAVSLQTADDLMAFFQVEAQKIEVVYNGVASDFVPAGSQMDRAKVEAFRRQKNLPEHFLLYLGTLEPRKNLLRLIDAYARWRTQAGAEAQETPLVLAGAKGWFYGQIFERVRALALQEVVRFPGFIAYEELVDWYRAATIFVYPSLFEGFGLPVLEAMACGTPVICSRTPSLLEVAGEATLTFEPEDTDGLVAAIEQLMADASLRSDLRQRGLAQASNFSWQKTARETIAVYEHVK